MAAALVAAARFQWVCEAIHADAAGRLYCSIKHRHPMRVMN